MTVRREKRRDPETGTTREFLIVDVVFQPADGGPPRRVRKVSPVQTQRGAERYEGELRQALLDDRRNPATVPHAELGGNK